MSEPGTDEWSKAPISEPGTDEWSKAPISETGPDEGTNSPMKEPGADQVACCYYSRPDRMADDAFCPSWATPSIEFAILPPTLRRTWNISGICPTIIC